jgi:hypothetical protein
LHEKGVNETDLACARSVFVGEPPHIGMPHMPMDAGEIEAVRKALHRVVPELQFVERPETADLIVSVIFWPDQICTDCPDEPSVNWQAIVERGGPPHQQEYHAVGPYLSLEGHVIVGSNAVVGFAKQFRSLVRPSRCGS